MINEDKETFFGAFFDSGSLPPAKSEKKEEATMAYEGLPHAEPPFIYGSSNWFEEKREAGLLDSLVAENRLASIEEKLDTLLQFLLTPKRRGRPTGTTGIKKRKSIKLKLTKSKKKKVTKR